MTANSSDRTNHAFIIAEAGVNHNGSIESAKKLVDVAAKSGVDAVKFQTFTAEVTISRFAPKADYQVCNTGGAESQLDMVRRLELSEKAHRLIKEHCHQNGVEFMSTPLASI